MDRTIARHRPNARRPGLLARLRQMAALGRQRRALEDLNDHLLDDIGLTRDAARREAGRPVWDVPSNWRR